MHVRWVFHRVGWFRVFRAARSLVCRVVLLGGILLGGAVLAAGCRKASPAVEAEQLALVITREAANVKAATAQDPAAEVAESATRAGKAYERLTKLKQEFGAEPGVATRWQAAEVDYSALRREAGLSAELRARAEMLRSLKVRGYRLLRGTALPQLLGAGASAARQASTVRFEDLPPSVRELATMAAKFAELDPGFTSAPASSTADAGAQWSRVADTLEQWRVAEPPEVALVLALGLVVAGKAEFALIECERLDAAGSRRGPAIELVPVVRAVACSRLGFTQLAEREIQGANPDGEYGRQTLAGVHFFQAYDRGSRQEWKEADRHLAEAVRIWPNNPLVIYLTGERLLADGRREEALENFTRAAAGQQGAWLAPLLADRVRTVRDSQGKAPAMLYDPALISGVTIHLLHEEARGTSAEKTMARVSATAEGIVRRLLPETDSGSPDPAKK